MTCRRLPRCRTSTDTQLFAASVLQGMRNTEFTSWLAGFFLICDPETLSAEQERCISNHAKLCEYTENGRLTVTNFMIRDNLGAVSELDLRQHVLMQFNAVPCPSSEEICYFLQGVFEIGGKTRWTREDAQVVIHLLDRNVWGLAQPLLRIYYQLTQFVEADNDLTIDMSSLEQRLRGVFIHEIDPSYEYDPEVADKLHQGLE